MEIRGTAAVSGISVTQLSLTLPHSQSGQTTTTHLRKGESLVLQQAQESLNFIKSVLRRLQSNVCFDSRETALVFMERILGDIQQAKAILAADDQQNLMPLQTGTTEASCSQKSS
ncbi:hypothetical protein IWW55_005179 [Coemansia sp. RSA 2706]|nr:hypothetical protein IWW55_005179 [Coemansia sp. RSA 2706]KAJ2303395.1 hypothetical protein IWW54_005733 [Coemansia sp. RSA 2705]